MQHSGFYIHGKVCEPRPRKTFTSLNPATSETVATVCQVSVEDIEDAVSSSRAGFAEWSGMPAAEKARIMQRAAVLLRARTEELAELEARDTGKPLQEALQIDIPTAADAIEYFAGLTTTLHGLHHDLGTEQFFYTRREPLGICAGIGAWNYPLQIACWKSAPALACGNTMIFKPSELTPLTAIRLAEIYTEAGLPDGVFNVVQGDGMVGQRLVRHPAISKVSFTGSVATGQQVMIDAASYHKPVTLELGGKSPLIILDDAELDVAADTAVQANFLTQGEVCTQGSRVFVHHSLKDDFLRRVKMRTEKLVVGNPLDRKTRIGSLISERHLQKVLSYIQQARSASARLITGGHRVTDGLLAKGCFVAPTIFADCTDDMPQVKDEIFGPVMSVLTFTDEKEVLNRANASEYGLAAGVFTRDISRAHRMASQLQAGVCWINSWGATPVEMPFGGFKASGLGYENGLEALRQYTKVKSVYVELGRQKLSLLDNDSAEER
ncbi:betaine-aldehyde dehydrogenase [Endozoicomonadaceae bacterium StTr2]